MNRLSTIVLLAWAAAASAQSPGPSGILKATVIEDSPPLSAGQVNWVKDRLLIADRGNNRILEYRPGGEFKEIHKTEAPGGVALDKDGRLIIAARKPERLVRVKAQGQEEMLAPDLVGMPHHAIVHPDGTIFWSNFPDSHVRMINTKGEASKLPTAIGHNYGMAFSPKHDALFVTSKLPDAKNRSVYRFPLKDGVPEKAEVVFKTPDLEPNFADLPPAKDGSKTLMGWIGRVQGLAVDRHGNFYIGGSEGHSSGAAVAVITPDGKSVRAMILGVPNNIASLSLGGPEGKTLYIAVAGTGRLHKAELP